MEECAVAGQAWNKVFTNARLPYWEKAELLASKELES